jgi:hypothetical protein
MASLAVPATPGDLDARAEVVAGTRNDLARTMAFIVLRRASLYLLV